MTAKIYNIPSGLSPTDILAEVLAAPNPAAELTETLVLLPNRRACRELRDAFVRLNGMQPTLLPRIMPLGDPDEDELFFTGALPEAEKSCRPFLPWKESCCLPVSFLPARKN